MSSLAISGLTGGGIATDGFSGPVDGPVPPVVTATGATHEYGAGTVATIHVGEGQVIIGPWQTIDRTQIEIKVAVRGDAAFDLNYEFSTDKGSTWYVGEQAASAVVSVDDGSNYANEAHFHVNVGYWWRISVFNTDVSPLNIAFEWRFHEF